MGEQPALRNVYAPAFHAAGALLAPVLGLAGAVQLLALLGAAALYAGFRAFQRSAGLPAECTALFAWAPYGFALSWCLPKVEAAGYGMAFAGLALLLRRRHAWLAVVVGATFWVHTAAALFLGLAGGVLALARRDRRALAALAGGCALAAPLWAAHLADGCRFAEALLFSQGDYLRSASDWSSLGRWPRLLALSGPLAVGFAALGARRLWGEHRAVAILAGAILVLVTNELWLAPFGGGTTLNLMRGLTLFAAPVAMSGGVWLASRSPRTGVAGVAACAAIALLATLYALPGSCHRVPVDVGAAEGLVVDRCTFRWARAPR